MWRTLLVDDNPSLREVLHVAADMDGRFEVIGHAEDGLQALEAAQWLKPDLILLDVLMPRMDGLTVLPQLQRACPDADIILLTSTDPPELPDGVGFVSKDVNILRLYEKLAAQLEPAYGERTG